MKLLWGGVCEELVRPRKGPWVSRKLRDTGLGGRIMTADEIKLYEITHCLGLKNTMCNFGERSRIVFFFILPRHLRLFYEALYVRLA